MALDIDLSRPLRSRADLCRLVSAIYDAPAAEQETNWLEWKGPLDLTDRTRAARAAIAKAVLGFANRHPDIAARSMGGCAYFVAGVSPGELAGVEVVDAAALENQVASFVGRDISWRADYVELNSRHVLVVTVEPPRWGDHAQPVRKTYNPEGGGSLVLQEGELLVRHQASTERRSAADVDMLSRRAARRPGDELAVQLQTAPETALRAVDLSRTAMADYVQRQQMRLLAPLSPMARQLRVGMSAYQQSMMRGYGGEYRTEDAYRESVSGYVEALRERLPRILRARSLLHKVARLKLEVVNNTDTTFSGVQVEAWLPADCEVSAWPEELREEGEPPKAPPLYGHATRAGLMRPAFSVRPFMGPSAAYIRRPDVEERVDGVYVEYSAETVRAQGVASLPSVWLRVENTAIEHITVRCEATATSAGKRLRFSFDVPVLQPPVTVEELMDELPEEYD